MKLKKFVVCALLCLAPTHMVLAATGVDDVKALGTTLTPMGAEMAGNKDGTIPAWTGGLRDAPACHEQGSGRLCDPFADEKPLLSITAENMAEYADRLSEGQKALLKTYPSYRIDVYPSHRSVALPQSVYENTAKNVGRAQTTDGGVGLVGAHGGAPFPIPKDGFEVMWNHLTRYLGQSRAATSDTYNVDAAGNTMLAVRTRLVEDFPYYDPDKAEGDVFWRMRHNYIAPPRQAGWGLIIIDPLSPAIKGRRAWQYLPGQRRVRLAPDLAFDTPATQNAGAAFFDDIFMFNGSMERYDFELIGKKEMYVPYNNYKYVWTASVADLLQPNHINPDVMRWEMHRVWVVEASLKSNARHAYAKRRFYVDEDSWFVLLNESYDARGELWRTAVQGLAPNYEALVPSTTTHVIYDLNKGSYTQVSTVNEQKIEYGGPQGDRVFAPDALAGAGVR